MRWCLVLFGFLASRQCLGLSIRARGDGSLGGRWPVPSGHSGFCMSKNMACSVEQDSDKTGNLLHEYNNTNLVGCSERCSLVPECGTWTWWGDSDRCQLFSTCTTNVTNCSDCQTGPKSCGVWNEHVSAVTGGLGGHDSVLMVQGNGVCNSSLKMPVARWGHASAFIKSRLILCGGTTGAAAQAVPSASCHIYCLETGNWSQGASLETARHRPAGVALLGKMYMVGGETAAGATPTMEVYDPSENQWSHGPDLPIAVTAACAVTFRDAIIVSGGVNTTGESREVFLFNVTTNKWWHMESMRTPRAKHACSVNQRPTFHAAPAFEMIVTGGENKKQVLSSAESFSLEDFHWSNFTGLTAPLESHVQTELAARPEVLGGQTQAGAAEATVLQFFDQYNQKEWRPAGYSLPVGLVGHSITSYPKDVVRC